MIRLCVGLLAGLFTTTSVYAFNVPRGLNDADRREVTRTLGANSANKLLTNPYPLGGYDGWEIGYAVEVVNVRDLRGLGTSPATDESTWRYSRLTFGKGLYGDVDVFLSFAPPVAQVALSDYGGTVRWSAYQAAFLPINVSLLVHGNQMNFANRFTNRNVAAELTIGINVDAFSMYFGGGVVQATGTFTGPDANGACGPDCTVDDATKVNSISRTVSSGVRAARTTIGFGYHFDPVFVAFEVDRVRTAVYSFKLGVRF